MYGNEHTKNDFFNDSHFLSKSRYQSDMQTFVCYFLSHFRSSAPFWGNTEKQNKESKRFSVKCTKIIKKISSVCVFVGSFTHLL